MTRAHWRNPKTLREQRQLKLGIVKAAIYFALDGDETRGALTGRLLGCGFIVQPDRGGDDLGKMAYRQPVENQIDGALTGEQHTDISAPRRPA